ncbi:UNVERIFIED_CONTAM: hypothetical protein PYX00_003246 [Menopon gallinae]|uniref:Alkyl transferase n=1 Tax=Menopon gallinae TaxID=328185 RepID=A0AAW2I100_9NEOP
MSWITDSSLSWLQRLALQIMKAGAVPRHVAFIMDGNRRFASKTNVEKSEGHSKGFDKLSEVLKWCLELGVKEVTVYAFSIENFKRPKDEVDALMDLANKKFEKLLSEEEVINEEGVNIRVIGDLQRLPPDLYKSIAKGVCMTRSNTRARMNIAFSYTARNELTEAVKSIMDGLKNDNIEPSDIDTYLIEHCLYTEDSDPPDLLIRTSGEVRLSDFLLWQASYTCLYFTPVLWPEFTFWDFLQAVFHYQRSVPVLPKWRDSECKLHNENERVENFLKQLQNRRYDELKSAVRNV